MGEHQIQINWERCIGCGLCQKDCPANNIAVSEKKAAVRAQNCLMCGHCAAVCPKAAISLTGFQEPAIGIEKQTILDPQQLLEAIRTRRSIRQFRDQPVPAEVIAQIIETGRLTPTGGNAQDVSYIVLKDHMGHCEELAVRFFRKLLPWVRMVNPMARNITVDDHYFFKEAPAVILVLSKNSVNGTLAASNMALMAEASGLGVLYSGFFTLAAGLCRPLRKALGLARREKVAATLVLGYSAVTYYRTVQKEQAAVRSL